MQNRRIVLFLPFSGHAYNVYYSIWSYMTDIGVPKVLQQARMGRLTAV